MVERFTPCDWPHATMVEDSDGGYVSYYDYEKLQQRLTAAEAELDRLKDENDRLRKTLEEIRDDRSFGDNAAPLLRSIAKLELIRIAKTALREVEK